MRARSTLTILSAAAMIFAATAIGPADAFAQDSSKKASASSAQKKAPGKTCTNLASNSQEHKDCIARQAKMDKTAKDKKLKAEKAPKKS